MGFQMGGMMIVMVVAIMMSMTVAVAAEPVEVHHVVGGDRGWDPTSDILSWSSGKVFRVGDNIYLGHNLLSTLLWVRILSKEMEGSIWREIDTKFMVDHRFAYSAAEGLVAELSSGEEYESCDLSNPIMMYTEGLHTIPLEREGIRYFVSSNSENCKNGLKLHVNVLPKTSLSLSHITPIVQAAGPTTPSASARYGPNTILGFMVMLFCVTVGLAY